MASGYVWGVKDGSHTRLLDFAVRMINGEDLARCEDRVAVLARLAEPRPVDAYYIDSLEQHKAELYDLERLTPAEAEKAAEKSYQTHLRYYNEAQAEAKLSVERYDAMLRKLDAWQAPPSCQELKDSMRRELLRAVEWDGSRHSWESPKRQTGAEYLRSTGEYIRRMIAMSEEQLKAQRLETERNNRFRRELVESLTAFDDNNK